MDKFQSQSELVTWHIQSKFHKEMSSKSLVVSKIYLTGFSKGNMLIFKDSLSNTFTLPF